MQIVIGVISMKKFFSCLLFVVFVELSLLGAVSMPAIFSDNMVLQRDKNIKIWGWAEPDEKVILSLNNITKEAVANKNGDWQIELPPMPAGGAYELKVKSTNNELIFKNVMLGEVFLCSGQSNMAHPMAQVVDAANELAKANNPNLRLFKMPVRFHNQAQKDTQSSWFASNPKDIRQFSGVAWYFGDKLQKELNVPVGIIDSSVGATRIESWMNPEAFKYMTTTHRVIRPLIDNVEARVQNTPLNLKLKEQFPQEYQNYYDELAKLPPMDLDARKYPVPEPDEKIKIIKNASSKNDYASLYNAMIAPMTPLTIRGIVWYQGEANRGDNAYADKLKYLWDGWCEVLQQKELPFYVIQIAPFAYKGADRSPEMWEMQQNFADKYAPLTGLILTMDTGDLNDIHPKEKKIVGFRVANMALNRLFDRKELKCDSPLFDTVELKGNEAIVKFRNAEELKTRDGKAPDYFQVAGDNKQFFDADAQIVNKNSIKLTSKDVNNIKFVRYAWFNQAQPNLMNEIDLPAGAFRTDKNSQ